MFLQNFVTIRRTVAELLQVFDFQYGDHPPSWIFKICNFHLPHGLGSRSDCSCIVSSRSDEGLRSYCKFSVSNKAAVRHMGFFIGMRGTSSSGIVGVYQCAKFGLNGLSSFDNIEVYIFLRFVWKLPIHALFVRFWGHISPK